MYKQVNTHLNQASSGAGKGALTRRPWLVAGWAHLAHTLLEQGEALPKAAQGGSGGSLQEKQVLVQGSEGAGAWKGLDGVHEVLLLTFHLVHHLENKDNRDKERPQAHRELWSWDRDR